MMRAWFAANIHVAVLFALVVVMLCVVLYLIVRGMDPAKMEWAKEQIAAVIGALLYSLKPNGSRAGGKA
jgi:hypothetical protein